MTGVLFYIFGMVVTAVYFVLALWLKFKKQLANYERESDHEEHPEKLSALQDDIDTDAKFCAVAVFFWPVVWAIAPFIILANIFSWVVPKLVFREHNRKQKIPKKGRK